MSIQEALPDRVGTLRALAFKLAAAIDDEPEPRDLAALSLRLERVLAELEALGGPAVKGSWEERLNARREAKAASSD